jgi:hypothetical protein
LSSDYLTSLTSHTQSSNHQMAKWAILSISRGNCTTQWHQERISKQRFKALPLSCLSKN